MNSVSAENYLEKAEADKLVNVQCGVHREEQPEEN